MADLSVIDRFTETFSRYKRLIDRQCRRASALLGALSSKLDQPLSIERG
ncbi:hypothetical protein [Bradyrhizobium macuxiense]|nr:hypothetical protein [Bradyrhizobium macuxiense]